MIKNHSSITSLFLCAILFAVISKPLAFAGAATESQESKLEDVLEGFDDNSTQRAEPHISKTGKRYWDLTGSSSLGSSYNYLHKVPSPGNTDYRGLSRLRTKLLLKLKLTLSQHWKAVIAGNSFYDFAYLANGRSNYTQEVIQEYEAELQIGESYLQGTLLSNLDLKIGRQIIVWGKSDNIRITDILNPLDNREPGMVDIEDIRLPITMTRVDYYFGDWNFSSILILEKRFDKNPAFGNDFYALTAPLPREKSQSGTEYAFALNGIFTGWDISLYFARILDDKPHFEQRGELELYHSWLDMGGIAANFAYSNFLFKTESAWFNGLEFRNLPDQKKSRYDVLFGIDYQGFTDQTISFEIANRHIVNFEPELENFPDSAEEDEFQTAIRYSGDFKHDRLHILLLASIFGTNLDGGSFQRFSVRYDLEDDFFVTFGVVNYDSGDFAAFKNIGNNDRIFIDFKYSF